MDTNPVLHLAPVYNLQRNSDHEYVIVQLLQDSTWKPISVGYKYDTAAWAKIGRMVTREQRNVAIASDRQIHISRRYDPKKLNVAHPEHETREKRIDKRC